MITVIKDYKRKRSRKHFIKNKLPRQLKTKQNILKEGVKKKDFLFSNNVFNHLQRQKSLQGRL